MKRKTIACVIVAIVVVLVIVGVSTGVLPGKVFPLLKKAALAIPPKMWTRLLFKILVLTGLMGQITKIVNARKERFLNGEVEYSLDKDYSLVVGYDFQTRPLIKRLLDESSATTEEPKNKVIAICVAAFKWLSDSCGSIYRWVLNLPPDNCVLLITDRDVRKIMADMATELTEKERKRVLYMRRDLASSKAYASLRIRGAKVVYLMGDEGVSGRDGIILQASKVIAEKVAADIKAESCAPTKGREGTPLEPKEGSSAPVKVYLQFEAPEFYSQMCSEHLPMDPETYPNDYDDKEKRGKIIPETVLFDLEVFNYYDSWVWKCWSEKDSADGGSPYLPLRFKPDAEWVELFVIGSGKAMKAVVYSAMTLMNYGEDARRCRMTVVSDRSSEILPPDDAVSELPELETVEYSSRDLNRKVAAQMLEAAADEKRAVTVVIVEDAPEKVVKTYLNLPFALRNKKMSVLLWMGSQSRNIPEKALIQVDGDKTTVRYFGMTDCLPWYGSNRQKLGVAVQYYYSDCYGDKRLPNGTDATLIATARSLWNEDKAIQDWTATTRWGKWSSISSASSFKEKMAIIGGRELTPELQLRLLKAEHNRWWTERLLGDWRLGARDNERRRHPNLVPFDKLDDFTKDIDKLCIAAMAQQGFITAG